MNKKAIIFGVAGIYLLLTAAAVYYLIEIRQLSFTMAFLTATAVFGLIISVVMFLLRDKLYSNLKKISTDRKERLLANYMRQYKLYKFMLWQSPLYVLVFVAVYKYAPDLEIDNINIAVIAVSSYLGVILSMLNKRYVINMLKEN